MTERATIGCHGGPDHHIGSDSDYARWEDMSLLPGHRADENEATVEGWMDKLGKLPD